jgi:hypothetical protein
VGPPTLRRPCRAPSPVSPPRSPAPPTPSPPPSPARSTASPRRSPAPPTPSPPPSPARSTASPRRSPAPPTPSPPPLTGAIDGLTAQVTGAANAVAAPLTGAIDGLTAQVTGAVDQLAAPLTGAIDGLTAQVTGAVDQLTAPLTGAVDQLTAPLTGAVGDLTGQVTGAVDQLTAPLTGALGGLTGQVTDAIGGLTGPLSDAVGAAGGALADAAGVVGDPLGSLLEGAPAGLRAGLDQARTALSGGDGGGLVDALGRAAAALVPPDLRAQIESVAGGAMDLVRGAARDLGFPMGDRGGDQPAPGAPAPDGGAPQRAGGGMGPQPQTASDLAAGPNRGIAQRKAAITNLLAQAQARAGERKRRVAEMIQPKLAVGDADTSHEREADRAADQVMAMGEADVSGRADGQVQRLGRAGGDPALAALLAGELPDDVEARVERLQRTGGRSLSSDEREFFEPRFGHDLGDVRVHDDGEAAELAGLLGARAFAVGHHIALGAGERVDGGDGRRLLAHELAHVIQQTGGQPRAATPAVREADAVATDDKAGRDKAGWGSVGEHDRDDDDDAPTVAAASNAKRQRERQHERERERERSARPPPPPPWP